MLVVSPFASLLPTVFALQATQASIVGTVREAQSGATLAGVTVFLIDVGRGATSDSTGRYRLHAVPSGPQHVAVRRIGYAPSAFHALVPASGELEINVALRARPLPLHAVYVRGTVVPPMRGLEEVDSSSFPDRSLTMAAVRNHPLLAEPDILQALGGGAVRLQPESPNGLHVRGGASDQTAYLIDGIPILSPYHAAGTFSAWNPDALSAVELHATSPSLGFPDALAGAVVAASRTAVQHGLLGSLSTTEARLTADGPGARPGSGYLLSARSTFPGFLSAAQEASYLRNESADWFAKVEWPLFRGQLRVLGYTSENEVSAAGSGALDSIAVDATRHGFEWGSRSIGTTWTRPLGGGDTTTSRRAAVHVRAWSALADANAGWHPADSAAERLTSIRRDIGVLVMLSVSEDDGRGIIVGLRMQRIRTRYASELETQSQSSLVEGSTPVGTAFLSHTLAVGTRTTLDLALGGTIAAGATHVSPRLRLRHRPNERFLISASYRRLQQYAQSLRNTESVVSSVFPMDLFVVADEQRVPVARAEQGVVALEFRPRPGLRIDAHAYERRFHDVLLVPPRASGPFATADFVQGEGDSRGVAIDASIHGSRLGVLASYGLQRVRLRYTDGSYIPEYGAMHDVTAGVIAFPAPTLSLKLGVTSLLGRRTTPVRGAFEWEACNLLDRGCEFAGNPQTLGDRIGAARLPAYFRVDLAARKHWHTRLAGRDALVGVFTAVTNLLDRKNVMTVVVDPLTGRSTNIDIRPLAPLVVGIDWRY